MRLSTYKKIVLRGLSGRYLPHKPYRFIPGDSLSFYLATSNGALLFDKFGEVSYYISDPIGCPQIEPEEAITDFVNLPSFIFTKSLMTKVITYVFRSNIDLGLAPCPLPAGGVTRENV